MKRVPICIQFLCASTLWAVSLSAQTAATPQTAGQSQPDAKQEKPQKTEPQIGITPPVTGNPQTHILDSSAVGRHTGSTGAPDPLLDTPPAPKGDPTLIGGLAMKVDRVRNRITIEPFGTGRRVPIYIDERTRLYRNGAETTILGVQKGDRVYADTVLDGPRVFAKNVRVLEKSEAAEVRGQVTAYDPQRSLLTLQDALSQRSVTFQVDDQTAVQNGRREEALAAGALIDVQFQPGKNGRGAARQITVLAAPGATYVFSGVLTNVNMGDGTLSIDNQSDGKTYDVEFAPGQLANSNLLRTGSSVSISTTFDGAAYRVSQITPITAGAASSQDTESK